MLADEHIQIGSLICYRFTDLTTAGVSADAPCTLFRADKILQLPLRPAFVGEAIDKDCPRDAEVRARASNSLKKYAF